MNVLDHNGFLMNPSGSAMSQTFWYAPNNPGPDPSTTPSVMSFGGPSAEVPNRSVLSIGAGPPGCTSSVSNVNQLGKPPDPDVGTTRGLLPMRSSYNQDPTSNMPSHPPVLNPTATTSSFTHSSHSLASSFHSNCAQTSPSLISPPAMVSGSSHFTHPSLSGPRESSRLILSNSLSQNTDCHIPPPSPSAIATSTAVMRTREPNSRNLESFYQALAEYNATLAENGLLNVISHRDNITQFKLVIAQNLRAYDMDSQQKQSPDTGTQDASAHRNNSALLSRDQYVSKSRSNRQILRDPIEDMLMQSNREPPSVQSNKIPCDSLSLSSLEVKSNTPLISSSENISLPQNMCQGLFGLPMPHPDNVCSFASPQLAMYRFTGSDGKIKHYSLHQLKEDLKEKYPNYASMKGTIVNLASCHNGSKVLQDMITGAPDYICHYMIDEISSEIRESASDVLSDNFGNFFFQALFRKASCDQKSVLISHLAYSQANRNHFPSIFHLCTDRKARIALQNLMEDVIQKEMEPCLHMFLDAIICGATTMDAGNILWLCSHESGTHIILRFINHLPAKKWGFLFETIVSHVKRLVEDRFGGTVVRSAFSRSDYDQKYQMINGLIQHINSLCYEHVGSLVIQHILSSAPTHEFLMMIVSKFQGYILSMSTNKYASTVVETCISVTSECPVRFVFDEILSPNTLDELLDNPNGQRVLCALVKHLSVEQIFSIDDTIEKNEYIKNQMCNLTWKIIVRQRVHPDPDFNLKTIIIQHCRNAKNLYKCNFGNNRIILPNEVVRGNNRKKKGKGNKPV